LSLLATAVGLASVVQMASAQTVPAGRVDDAAADLAQSLPYWRAKAQCWADLAAAERSQGDTHGTPATAEANARRIREALQAGTEPDAGAEQPIFSRKYLPAGDSRYGRPKWREDIQTIDAVLSRYRERRCRTANLGCLEVAQQSVYENMEETRGARWNHGRPEIDKALSLASEASAEFDSACAPPKSLQSFDVSKIERPLEEIAIPADTLFKFDRSDPDGLVAGGREAIIALASKVQSYGSRAGGLEIVGHTDRLGQSGHNATLSQRRAATVGALLKRAGVTLPFGSKGVGAAEPTTGNACRNVRPHATLVDCLQPDRRVVVRILPASQAN
jgi:outer membrane protein OmpA-like peptidoglycan-associated protein